MSKIISVSDDVYKKMKMMKGDDSYSKLIKRFIDDKGNKEEILKFAGKDFIDEDVMNEWKKGWKKWTEKYA